MRTGGGTLLAVSLAAVAVCLGPRAVGASCTIPPVRPLPCEGCGESEPGGLYPGEVYAEYGHGDARAQYCRVGGTIPEGQQCEVQCQKGYGDLDGTDSNHVACISGDLDWTKLPKCVECSPDSYQDEQSSDPCKLCPGDRYTNIMGATSREQCNTCKPGTTGQPGNCQLTRRTDGWGTCPDRCDPKDGQSCAWSWNNHTTQSYDFSHFANDPANCDVVNIVTVVTTVDDFGAGQWIDGLRIFQEHINSLGGLRLGENSVGYVNLTVVRVDPIWSSFEQPRYYQCQYENLCYEDGLGNCKAGMPQLGWRAHVATKPTVFITPPDVEDDITNQILALSLGTCEGFATFLAGSEARFPQSPHPTWPGVFSVYGQESSLVAPGENTMSPVALLYGEPYNARTFGIAGAETQGANDVARLLRTEIEKIGGSLTAPISLAVTMASTAVHESMQSVAKTQPDVFIGIGDGQGVVFESMLSFFAGKGSNKSGYSPNASFYMGGLAVSTARWRNSYTYGVPEDIVRNEKLDVDSEYLPCHGTECWSFDQWMGFVPWTKDMPHAGPNRWPTDLSNPYRMAPDNPDAPHLGMRQRYLGSAEDFNQVASAWLKRQRKSEHGLSPSFYHAKAAASLLLFQMAVELAPEGHGFGLLYTNLTRDNIEIAMHDMNSSKGVETFWGPIRILKDEGWNHFFSGMSIGQFKDNNTYPSLVHYTCTGHSEKNVTIDATYPAVWPDWCLVHGLELNPFDECPFTYLHKTEILVWSVATLSSILALVCCCCFYLRRRNTLNQYQSSRAMRKSLLGSAELPNTQLTALDVASRWASSRVAARANDLFSSASATSPSSRTKTNSFHIASAGSGGIGSSVRMYTGLTQQTQVPVMFTDSHVRELQPTGWRQLPKSRLGKGTYGTVYRAEWRGVPIAVKTIELPSRPKNDRDTARAAHRRRLQKITKDFVKEVDVGCELLHPNLVQMLGYATDPVLLIIQELMDGGSLDKQLYVEHWRPNSTQLYKAALDVAQGMEFLHTHFERGAKGRASKVTLPVIHRDLKSPNILLDRPPPLTAKAGDWPVDFKVSDFGLSRDKQLDTADDKTGAMSGVGSVLWMAPEMLRGDTYNESVDVYSYAMVLVELSHHTMPWQDTGARPHEVPHRVTTDERPVSQLREAPEELKELIQECWHRDPAQRPTFTQIVERVTEMYLNANRDAAERLSKVQENRSGERDTVTDTSTEYGSSRPASPGTMLRCGGASSSSIDLSDQLSY